MSKQELGGNPRHPNQKRIIDELLKSMRLQNDGLYHQSLAAIDRLRSSVSHKQGDLWAGWGYVLQAKARFHLEDTPGAVECLLRIPGNVLSQSPELAAEHASLEGLILKRSAYLAWKQGQTETARRDTEKAIVAFQRAHDAAFGDTMQLIRSNSLLNKVYAQGLMNAINRESSSANGILVCDAIRAENEIRRWSPPATRNDMTGMTIVADLARAANLTVADVLAFDNSPEAQAMVQSIIGDSEGSWPSLLLSLARTKKYGVRFNAQGLVLGATMLVKPPYHSLLPKLGFSFQIDLLESLLDLQSETQRETTITGRIRAAIQAIDRAAGTRFPGRRVFR